jgi:two-component system, oxyanion-binding sensor
MVRWKQCEPTQQNADAARGAYRPDIYRTALQQSNAQLPMTDFKAEHSAVDSHASSAAGFAAEGFFDGRTFDPADLDRYIASFATRP